MTRGSTAQAAAAQSSTSGGRSGPAQDDHITRTHSGRIKRWATQSVTSSIDDDDDEDDDEALHSTRGVGARSKRFKSAPGPSSTTAFAHHSTAAQQKTAQAQKAPHSQVGPDKEERKMARMIRNRSEFGQLERD